MAWAGRRRRNWRQNDGRRRWKNNLSPFFSSARIGSESTCDEAMTSLGGYYRLLADPAAISRWYLSSPIDPTGREIDPRTFTQGAPVGSQPPLSLPLRQAGDKVGFNFCDFDMVVTPSAINAELEGLVGPAIQRIPVSVENSIGGFDILNVCELVQCIDEARSLVTKWTAADGRPEKVGQFRMIAKLKIDPAAASGHHIFRAAGWPIALIVSENVKSLLEVKRVSGLKYERVDC